MVSPACVWLWNLGHIGSSERDKSSFPGIFGPRSQPVVDWALTSSSSLTLWMILSFYVASLMIVWTESLYCRRSRLSRNVRLARSHGQSKPIACNLLRKSSRRAYRACLKDNTDLSDARRTVFHGGRKIRVFDGGVHRCSWLERHA